MRFSEVREQVRQTCTREYKARGILLKRCDQCQLAKTHCICHFHTDVPLDIDIILLLHRNEFFKPTNTGKLIDQLFAAQTQVYCWQRTEPDEQLLATLNSPARECAILFPEQDAEPQPEIARATKLTKPRRPAIQQFKRQFAKPTLIILDGTWRQARRMLNQSRYLDGCARFNLSNAVQARYLTRKAAHQHYLSTAEAAALAFDQCGQHQASAALQQLFDAFNQNYAAMKKNRPPVFTG